MSIKDYIVIGTEYSYNGTKDMYKKVSISVHIIKNETNEIRVFDDYLLYDEYSLDEIDEPHLFIWKEGNYSCDCNRRIFWQRAKKEEEDWEIPCSEGLFSVNIYNKKNGACIYKEFKEER